MYVEQIMSRPVNTVTADTRLSQVSTLMQEQGRRFLPVVDEEGRLSGIVTHRELERAEPSAITTLAVGEVNYLMAKITAGQIMQKAVINCAPDTLVEEAGQLMRERRIGCLPVVEGGKLVGIVTDDDILDFLLDITGCDLKDTTRIAVHLPDRTGELSRLLEAINSQGGYIATVVSPTSRDETGMRIVIIRHRSEDPVVLDRYLRDQGYDLVTELLPRARGAKT